MNFFTFDYHLLIFLLPLVPNSTSALPSSVAPSAMVPTSLPSVVAEPPSLSDPSTNHGGPATCYENLETQDSQHCIITADFYPTESNPDYNTFNVYKHDCTLDPDSHKTMLFDTAHASDRSVFGKPLQWSFDVVDIPKVDARIGKSFTFNYGSHIRGKEIQFDPRRVEKPLTDLDMALTSSAGEVRWQNWECSDPKDGTRRGWCYALAFQCQDNAA